MNKQELLKQADYTFQRGNRELAKKYLAGFLAQYPNEESAWMLMARIVEEPERKIECYERALKLNPGNSEAKIWLARIKHPDKTLSRRNFVDETPRQASNPIKSLLRGVIVTCVIALGFGATTFVFAKNNPESNVAKLIIPATSTPFTQTFAENIAVQTRAKMTANYPQYAPLVNALIGFAVNNAENGPDGAPERPGAEIIPSDTAGVEAKTALENALPQPGSLSSATLTELQLTSWLAMEMKNNPDLPLSNAQVYLRDGKIQIWCMVVGSGNSTSALVVGNLEIDSNNNPSIVIESIQIGAQIIPEELVSQAASWLNQALIEKINKQAPGLQIMNIKVSSGLITVSGMR